MPKVDLDRIPQNNATGYPAPFDEVVQGRWKKPVGRAGGLTALGATHVTLKPGAWSSQRHWHEGEDEFLVMLSGEAVLIEDEGETILRAGDMAAWPMGSHNGHHLINRSAAECSFVCLSAGDQGSPGGYSDIDMAYADGAYFRRDGTPYPTKSGT